MFVFRRFSFVAPTAASLSAILGAKGMRAATFRADRQETLIALRNFAIVACATPLHHGRTSTTAAREAPFHRQNRRRSNI
jgi:hypothetical protein